MRPLLKTSLACKRSSSDLTGDVGNIFYLIGTTESLYKNRNRFNKKVPCLIKEPFYDFINTNKNG